MADNKMKISKTKLRQIIKEELGVLGEDSTTKEVWVKLKKDFVAGKEGQGNWLDFAHLPGLIVGKRRNGPGEDNFMYDIKWTLEDGTVLYSKNFQTELDRV
jgi:hypothetical protein